MSETTHNAGTGPDLNSIEFDMVLVDNFLGTKNFEVNEINRKIACDVILVTAMASLTADLPNFQSMVNRMMDGGAFVEDEREAAMQMLNILPGEVNSVMAQIGEIPQAHANLHALADFLKS